MEGSETLIEEMTHSAKISKARCKIVTPGWMTFFRNITTLLGIIINLIMLIYWRFEEVMQTHIMDAMAENLMQYIAYVQFSSNILALLFYMRLESKLIIHK